jgi:hypothetical protein
LYLEKFPQINSPKLYAAYFVDPTYFRPEGGFDECIYLVMEYIEGEAFEWRQYEELSESEQDLYTTRLGEQLKALRSIPSEGYYGRIYNQPFDPAVGLFRIRLKEFLGPFESSDMVLDAMYRTAELRLAEECHTQTMFHGQVEWARSDVYTLGHFKQILGRSTGIKPVLTLLDAKLRNFIAQPKRNDAGEIVDWEVTLIDLDLFGWHPAFLQIYCLKHHNAKNNETGRKFVKNLAKYVCEDDYTEVMDFLDKDPSLRWYIL